MIWGRKILCKEHLHRDRLRLPVLLFLMSIAVIFLDQMVKRLIMSDMTLGMSIPVLPGIFHITYIQNPGAAFGILAEQRWLFIAVGFLFVGAAVSFYRRLRFESRWMQCGTALLLGGAVGNLIDRIRWGEVVDFLDFRIWPVFNIADISIVIGVGCMMYALFRQDKKGAEG